MQNTSNAKEAVLTLNKVCKILVVLLRQRTFHLICIPEKYLD